MRINYQLARDVRYHQVASGIGILSGPHQDKVCPSPIAHLALSSLATGPLSLDELLSLTTDSDQSLEILQELSGWEKEGWIEKVFLRSENTPQEKAPNRQLGDFVRMVVMPELRSKVDLTPLANISIDHTPLREIEVDFAGDYLTENLKEHHRTRHQEGKAWLLVQLQSEQPLIGPWFVPGTESACWEWLEQRLLLHRPAQQIFRSLSGRDEYLERPVHVDPKVTQVLLSMLALEVIQILESGTSINLINQIEEVDHRSL